MDNKIFIHDTITGKSYERDMTAEEIAQAEKDKKTDRQANEITPAVG